MTVNYVYLGYGTTDENGECKLDHDANGDSISHSYTGTGAGKIDVVASLDSPSSISDSSLVSETFVLYDCLKYENDSLPISNTIFSKGNGSSNASFTRENGYSNLSEIESGTDLILYTGITHQCAIEFDVQVISTDYSQAFCALGQSQNANTRANIRLATNVRDGDWHTVKITFDNGNGTVAFDNGSQSDLSVTGYDSSLSMYFRFITNNAITGINFKNWKCYPI